MSDGLGVERMADGLIRLWTELQRRKDPGEASAHELTTSQAQALRLVILDGPQRIGSLARQLGVTMATASRTVDSLVATGLVRREAGSGTWPAPPSLTVTAARPTRRMPGPCASSSPREASASTRCATGGSSARSSACRTSSRRSSGASWPTPSRR